MCYDAKTQLRRQIKNAIHLDDLYETQALQLKLQYFEDNFNQSGIDNYYYHVSGFSHPLMFIYTSENPLVPSLATWGLIPEDCDSKEAAMKIRNMTLNARCESMHQKKSFSKSLMNKRCVIYFEGYYEHHHKNGNTFPYLISLKSGQMMPMAGLYTDWVDPDTGEELKSFSIVTTVANSIMTKIHNKPNSSEGPRMPVILSNENIMKWLSPDFTIKNEDQEKLIQLCVPIASSDLESYTVRKLKGKKAIGNVPEVINEVKYAELLSEQKSFWD